MSPLGLAGASVRTDGEALVGRGEEFVRIRAVIALARSGTSRSLIIRGDPGIGKIALLAEAAGQTPDFHELQTSGAESETVLPYIGLHALIKPVVRRINDLPSVQAAALRGAIGLSSGPSSVFLVAAALLTLLAGIADERPLLLSSSGACSTSASPLWWQQGVAAAATLTSLARAHRSRRPGTRGCESSARHSFLPGDGNCA